jgi:putative flippase GtrA
LLGGVAAVLELLLLKLLYEGLGWALPVATAVAAEVLILAKFVVADQWVFGHPTPSWSRALKYHGASAGAFVVYWLLINGLVEMLSLAYPIAFVLGTGAAFLWSLVTNFLWVWAQPARTPVE